jgi:small-conductance mechanosensitive channel
LQVDKTMKFLRLFLVLVLLSLALMSSAFGAWDPNELPPGFVVEKQGSPVELDGHPLFYLRVKQKVFSTEKRARKLSEGIKKLADDPTFDPKTIGVEDSPLSSDIMVGDQTFMPVWAFEAKVEGKPAPVLAREYAETIRQAIIRYQQEHSLRALVVGTLKTLVAIAVLSLLFILLLRGVRRINLAIEATQRIQGVKLGTFEFFTAERVKAVLVGTVKIFRLLTALFLFYLLLHLGLSFFPWTHKYAVMLYESLLEALAVIGRGIWDQIPSIIFLIVLILIARYVLKTLRFVFAQVEAGKITLPGVDAEVAPITYKIMRILVIAFVAVIAYPFIPGSDSAAFKGISIFLGVLFSLGSTSAIANLIAGISLTYTRAFREGDVIKVGDAMGVVLERKLYVTRIKTYKNQIVTIPNANILTNHVINLSQEAKAGDGLILHTSITIGYDAPWETIHALLIEAAHATKHILKSPSPFVLQTGLNDFYVTYELNAYTDAPEIMPRIYGELHQNIQDKFNEAGVEIMSPHYTQIRDGNRSTIPAEYLPPDYQPPAIRVTTDNGPRERRLKKVVGKDDPPQR